MKLAKVTANKFSRLSVRKKPLDVWRGAQLNRYSIDKLFNAKIGLLDHALWAFEEYLNGISEKVTPNVVTSR